MALWPFGRDPANVEIVSRVVTAAAGDNVAIRGKLTLHFAEPQTQVAADLAAEKCAALMEIVLREHRSHEQVLGAEAEMVLKLLDRLPSDIAPTRTIELAALHIVGDPGATARRRGSSMAMPQVPSQGARPRSVPSPPSSVAPHSNQLLPVSSGSPVRRRSSNRMRAITASMVLPVGSSSHAIGSAIAPLLRDTVMRLLIGFLRIHDLIGVRGVTLEEGSPDLQVAVSTILEPPQGEHEASRAAEIARWQAAIGVPVVGRLRREATTISVCLMYSALIHAEVPQNLTIELLEECCLKAAPGERSPLMDVERYLGSDGSSFPSMIAVSITRIIGGKRQPVAMIAALTPLLASVEEDMSIAATLAKHSLGL